MGNDCNDSDYYSMLVVWYPMMEERQIWWSSSKHWHQHRKTIVEYIGLSKGRVENSREEWKTREEGWREESYRKNPRRMFFFVSHGVFFSEQPPLLKGRFRRGGDANTDNDGRKARPFVPSSTLARWWFLFYPSFCCLSSVLFFHHHQDPTFYRWK